MIRFVMVWVGEKYDASYPVILQDMLARNASNLDEFTIEALTDRPDELPAGVHAIPANPDLPGWWQKVYLFSADMPWDEGDRIIYFDLDVAVTGRLEDLADTSGIIKDWHWPNTVNSSVMSWLHGEHRAVWDTFTPDEMTRPPSAELAPYLPKGQINGGDQTWIGQASELAHFPSDWFISYRDARDWPPNGCKAVIFHGQPKPAEVTDGWVPHVWKVGGFTSLPEFKGVNTTEDERLDNVRSCVKRDLPWFTGGGITGRTVVIVCGAPSMKAKLPQIKAHKKRGVPIVSVNNAWRFLHENGITPDVNVMLDARPQNAAFVKDAPKSMRVLLASQCHPDVFDALGGYDVSVWHSGHNDNTQMMDILAPWWAEGPDQKPCILVPGGSTVGLRSLWLAAFSGFRTIHLYGIDSSYADSGEHHAYAQPLNDGEQILPVVMGDKEYRCAKWMCRQAAEFRTSWFDLKAYEEPDGTLSPVTIHVHGSGLVPDMARILREEERAA